MNDKKATANKTTAHKIFEQIWNQANFEEIDSLVAPDAKFNFRGNTYPSHPSALKQFVTRWHTAFKDFHFEIEDMVAEGYRVAARVVMAGTHQAEWQGIPATGKTIRVTAMMFLRFEDGKVAEIWEDYDLYGLLEMLKE